MWLGHCAAHGRRRLSAAPLTLGLCLILSPDLDAQTFAPLEAPGAPPALNFEVLASTVVSGSRSQTRSERHTKLNALEISAETEDDYPIVAVADPFLPVEDPRDRVDSITLPEEAVWSPILRLELDQLKLVAVTTVSGQTGDALASFEDAAGLSYLLRRGDRIGRNKGRIVAIDSAGVVIEERPRGSLMSRVVEMRLII